MVQKPFAHGARQNAGGRNRAVMRKIVVAGESSEWQVRGSGTV